MVKNGREIPKAVDILLIIDSIQILLNPLHKHTFTVQKGIVDGQKIPTLTVIIRPLDTATYENMISALDEMLICSIDKYVIDKIGPEDKALIEKAGVK
jgi:hypothetical protein